MWPQLQTPANFLSSLPLSLSPSLPLSPLSGASRPASQPASHPAIQPAVQPSSHPASQPASQPSSQPAVQPSSHPASHPAIQPAIQPASQPARERLKDAEPRVQRPGGKEEGMDPGVRRSLLLYLLLSCPYPSRPAQGCLSRQKVLVAIRQMQQLLKGQESRFADGIHTMKAKLSSLQLSVSRSSANQRSAVSCPSLEAPRHGKKLGSKYSLDHEVHFICLPGYLLSGSSTRTCQASRRWTGSTANCTEVNECISNPCQNGGTCVDAVNHYTCICPNNWTGSYCGHPVPTAGAAVDLSELGDMSFSRRPRCAKVERAQHCSCDAGFHMSGTNEDSLCQDVDECEVYQMEGVTRLCMHACINVPGSYRCACPPTYRLLNDGRSCDDVDECATSQHNCTTEATCINTGGGYECVNPQCPLPHENVSYVKTSPFHCERHPCPMNSKTCHHAAKTISFHYLSMPSKLKTPVTLFRIASAAAPGRPGADSLRFGIASSSNRGQFVVQRSDRQTGELILVQPLVGPCTVEVDVDMSEYYNRTFVAKHLSKVTLFVSANGF